MCLPFWKNATRSTKGSSCSTRKQPAKTLLINWKIWLTWPLLEDKVIIYYSGHGFLRNETGYWIPVDASPGKRGQFIRNEVIRGCIKDIRARHILLISDSCFSGSLVTRDVVNPDVAIAELEKDKSRWVLSSGRQTEKVADGNAWKKQPLCYQHVLKVLRDNQQAKLNVAILADRVVKLTRYNWEQMPQGSPTVRGWT